MIVSVSGVEEPIYYAGPGYYTWKIVEAADRQSERGDLYIHILLVNSDDEYFQEALYVDQHIKRIYQLAKALRMTPDEGGDIDTTDFIGRFLKARIDYIKYDTGTKKGMKSDRMYLQNIRPSHKRRDTSGSRYFSSRVKKQEYGIGVSNRKGWRR